MVAIQAWVQSPRPLSLRAERAGALIGCLSFRLRRVAALLARVVRSAVGVAPPDV